MSRKLGGYLELGERNTESKVRLTGKDIRNGRLDAARERMGKEDSGLARHSVDCGSGIDWGEARVVAYEYGLRQRKAREGIESLQERSNGKVVLNNYEPIEMFRFDFHYHYLNQSFSQSDELGLPN